MSAKNYGYVVTAGMVLVVAISSCTPMKRAQLGIARGIGGSEISKVNGHEVYCSQGRVCVEVQVLSIGYEDRDGGRVRVVLKNQTGNTALVQIRLEIRKDNGEVLMETRPENVAIPPIQEKSYVVEGVAKKGAKVRVIMNAAG